MLANVRVCRIRLLFSILYQLIINLKFQHEYRENCDILWALLIISLQIKIFRRTSTKILKQEQQIL